jgi:hypothetical protein
VTVIASSGEVNMVAVKVLMGVSFMIVTPRPKSEATSVVMETLLYIVRVLVVFVP